MKKITFLFLLLLCGVMTNAQNLLSNGDFEQGMVTWIGNAFNVVEDGGNSFNLSDNEMTPNVFDVNLSHPVELTGGTTYTLSFDASTSVEDETRTIIAGVGLNEGGFENDNAEVTVTSDLQNFTLTLTPPLGSANSRAFFDLGGDAGVLVIDNVVLTVEGGMTGGGDELLSNGDFEQGMVTWIGNAFNVVEDGGNSFNLSDNEMTPNVFDVNLSHPVALEGGVAYTLSFDASTSVEDETRTIIAGVGLNEGGFENDNAEVTVTSDLQNFTLTLTPPLGSANSRAFFDLGGDAGVLVLDNVSLMIADDGGDDPVPTEAAPTPPARAEDAVFSIFSDAYTDQPDVVFGAFNVGTTDITPFEVDGDNSLQIVFTQPDPQFLLVDWGTVVDNTAMTHFHMDYWVDTSLSTGLIANPLWSNHVGDAGETSSFGLTNPVTTFGEWVSVDVPLTDFDFGNNSNNQQRDALRQFVLTLAGADNGARTLFLDNVYLHNNTTLSTEEFDALNVSVFPNPSINGIWNIEVVNQNITSVDVFDITGRRVNVLTPNANSVAIDASKFGSGIYIANVTTDNGTQSIKLIKR